MNTWTRLAVASSLLLACAGLAGAVTVQAPGGDTNTIQEVIDDIAVSGDTVQILPGTYDEAILLKSGITLEGLSTPAVHLRGGITAADNVLIRRLTVEGKGIVVPQGTSQVRIHNNILRLVDGAGVSVPASGTAAAPDVEIVNNTFYKNTEGCRLNNATGAVQANIFYQQTGTAVSFASDAQLTVSQNHFEGNGQNGSTGDNFTSGDPHFVAPVDNDFHFDTNAPVALQTLGAFEGTDADPKPQPVRVEPLENLSDADGTRIGVTWALNPAPEVTGYRVHYGTDETARGGTGAAEGDSPIAVGPGQSSLDLTGLEAPTTPPAVPTGVRVGAGDGELLVVWDPVEGADGYRVSWGTDPAALDHEADAGAVTSYRIRGLEIGVEYGVTVTADARKTYFVTVTALAGEESVKADVESLSFSASSDPSAAVTATPVNLSPGFSDLPDQGGCFLGILGGAPSIGMGWLAVLVGAFLAGLAAWGWRRPAGVAAAVLAAALALPGAARGEGFWVGSAALGAFHPQQKNWSDHFDQDFLFTGKLGLGYRFAGRWEVGLEGGYRRATGTEKIALQDNTGADLATASFDQTLTDVPVQVYGLYQFRGSEEQVVVPYVGAGLTRHYYRLNVDGGDDVRGHLSGYLARAGVRVALDRFEPRRSGRARARVGLSHTYLSVEGEYSRVDDFGKESANLGGWALYAGAVFDF